MITLGQARLGSVDLKDPLHICFRSSIKYVSDFGTLYEALYLESRRHIQVFLRCRDLRSFDSFAVLLRQCQGVSAGLCMRRIVAPYRMARSTDNPYSNLRTVVSGLCTLRTRCYEQEGSHSLLQDRPQILFSPKYL
jgi:hypothetical protein